MRHGFGTGKYRRSDARGGIEETGSLRYVVAVSAHSHRLLSGLSLRRRHGLSARHLFGKGDKDEDSGRHHHTWGPRAEAGQVNVGLPGFPDTAGRKIRRQRLGSEPTTASSLPTAELGPSLSAGNPGAGSRVPEAGGPASQHFKISIHGESAATAEGGIMRRIL
jgi:hypothetical protein